MSRRFKIVGTDRTSVHVPAPDLGSIVSGRSKFKGLRVVKRCN